MKTSHNDPTIKSIQKTLLYYLLFHKIAMANTYNFEHSVLYKTSSTVYNACEFQI